MTKLIQLGNSKEAGSSLSRVCAKGLSRVCLVNLKLTVTIGKTKKGKIIFHTESGGIPGIPSGLFHEGS